MKKWEKYLIIVVAALILGSIFADLTKIETMTGQTGESALVNPVQTMPEAEKFPMLVSDSVLQDAVYAKLDTLPDKDSFYDTLVVNEAYAERMKQTVAAVLESEEAEKFEESGRMENNQGVSGPLEWNNPELVDSVFDRYAYLYRPDRSGGEVYRLSWEETIESTDVGTNSSASFQGSLYMGYAEQGVGGFSDATVWASSSDVVKRLEGIGYTGLREWMQKVEEEIRLVRVEEERYGGGFSRFYYETVINGILFLYGTDTFSITFWFDEYYIRPEAADQVTKFVGDGLLLYGCTANGDITMLEYATPDENSNVAEGEGACKHVKLYYKNGEMIRLEVLAKVEPRNGIIRLLSYGNRLYEAESLVSERETGLFELFLGDLGLDRATAQEYLQRMEQDYERSSLYANAELEGLSYVSECIKADDGMYYYRVILEK